MKTNVLLAAGFVAMCGLLSGCAHDDSRNTGGRAETMVNGGQMSSHTFAFERAGIKASSRVERRLAADGGESLHGVTSVALPGAAHPPVLEETAQIDASGRLVLATADLRSGPSAARSVRSIRLDAASGAVTVRDDKGVRSWRVQADEPWIYEGLVADIAPEMGDATAIQAWVARRAAHASTRLRSIGVAAREDHLTLADQVAFADGASEWIVLGDEALETDADFTRALRWKTLEDDATVIQAAERCEPGPV